MATKFRSNWFLSLASILFVVARASQVTAETPARSEFGVQRASFDRSATSKSAERVTFSKRSALPGDRVEQTLDMELKLSTTTRVGNQIGEKKRTTTTNDQQRAITVGEVENGRAVLVEVRYAKASQKMNEAAAPGQVGELADQEIQQPVAGKTYLCRREPGENGNLTITDVAGKIPPSNEYEIVAQHMEMIGRPHPLAEYLAGRSIGVGESVELPKAVADKVFNLGEQFGEITHFTLTLEKLERRSHGLVALFSAEVEAASSGASQMRLELEGPLEIEPDTCRVAKVDLIGPIAMSETRGSYSTAYQLIGTGQLKIGVASVYRDARR